MQSLRAQRLHNIDARCARRRQHRGDDGGSEQHESRDDHGQGAGHLQAAEIASSHMHDAEAKSRSSEYASGSHDRTLRNHTSQQILRLRTERETNAEFAGACTN